jgi:flagellar motor switch protein FliN
MKSFLTAWLAEAPKVLSRELAGELQLRPSAQLPQPETATTLAVTLKGPYNGRFLVTADRYALHALLSGARVTDGSLDAERDRELWRAILHQIAAAAAESFDPTRAAQIILSIEDASWTLGLASAAYELRFGETLLLLAFTDEIQASEIATPKPIPEKDAEVTRETSSGPTAPPRITPGGIDLLLDVELEASLRFGSREMPLNEVLDLGAGDVIELDRHVSDPVDLLVGDKIVARGEVVLVNGSFGLRVLEVAEPKKCLESIRCLF